MKTVGRTKQSRSSALVVQSVVVRCFEQRERTSAADTEVLGAFSKVLLCSLSIVMSESLLRR